MSGEAWKAASLSNTGETEGAGAAEPVASEPADTTIPDGPPDGTQPLQSQLWPPQPVQAGAGPTFQAPQTGQPPEPGWLYPWAPVGQPPYGQSSGQPSPGQPPYGAPPGQPPYGAPYGQPPYGAPPGQPPYGAPPGQTPYGAPYGQPPYGQPPYGAPYGQPQYGPRPYPGYYLPPPQPTLRRRRLRVIPLIVIALVIIGLMVGSVVNFSPSTVLDPQQPQLGRFAGYIWYGDVTQVSASWRVPKLVPTTPDGSASTWIGVQGPGKNTFFQIGVTEESYGGTAFYQAFWSDPAAHFHAQELYVAVSAGDEIQARIARVNGTWEASLADVTDSQSGNAPTNTAEFANVQMAEWVQEDPTLPRGAAPYPELTPSTIQNVMVNAAQPSYSSLQPQVMVLPHHVRVEPGPLVDDSFTTKQVSTRLSTLRRAGRTPCRRASRAWS